MGPEPVNILVSDAFLLCFHRLTLCASLFGIADTRLALVLGVKDPMFPGDVHGLI